MQEYQHEKPRRSGRHCRILAALTAAAVCALAVLTTGCGRQWSRMESFAMNTILEQQVEGPEAICAGNLRIAADLETALSRTEENSEISRLAAERGMHEVSPDTEDALRIALEGWEATEGAYDPTLGALRDAWGFGTDAPRVPEANELAELLAAPGAEAIQVEEGRADTGGADIDLGGMAKGLALDRMREYMDEESVENAIVSFGGAVLAMGQRPDGGPWRVGVRDPLSADTAGSYAAVIEVTDAVIETSGISEQNFEQNGILYHHLLDPETGRPADNDLASVTVAGQSGAMADILSTALFVMGPEQGTQYAEENDVGALFISRSRKIWTTDAFPYEITEIDPAYACV